MLGDTDVNSEIRSTLQDVPDYFWYFNNGITLTSSKITKTMAGGSGTDFGTFHCENISVVNGAQTVSTIGRFNAKLPEKVAQATVPIRIISLEHADMRLENSITKTNNRQNRIDNRDFVTLDPEQSRLRAELGVDGIMYHVIRSEAVARTESSFDLVEATTALACASKKPSLFVQLKREIGKLWEDINRSPYKELFNPLLNSLYLWRSVQTQRLIDKCLEEMIKLDGLSGRELGIAVHGNRLISALVFHDLPVDKYGDPTFDANSKVTQERILESSRANYGRLKTVIDTMYPNAIIPTLFKNMGKCNDIYSRCIDPGSTQ